MRRCAPRERTRNGEAWVARGRSGRFIRRSLRQPLSYLDFGAREDFFPRDVDTDVAEAASVGAAELADPEATFRHELVREHRVRDVHE
jgi:hypothetical protein